MSEWEFPTPKIELTDLMTKLATVADNTSHVEFEFGKAKYLAKHNAMTTEDTNLKLNKDSFRQLCDLIDVPSKYAERMPDELSDYTVNYFLANGPRRPYNALVDKDQVVRSFMRPDLPYVRHDALFEAITDAFDGEAPYVHRWGASGGKFHVQLRSPELTFEDPGGSVLFGGLSMTYDDSWKTSPVFKTFLNRLVCDNGASVNVDGRKFRVDGYSSAGVLEQASEFSSLALNQVRRMVDGLISMQKEKVRNAEYTIRSLCMRNRLPNKIREVLLRYLSDEGYLSTIPGNVPENMYDIVNLFTYVGTHDFTIPQEYRDILCEIGGGAMFAHDPMCGECGSTI